MKDPVIDPAVLAIQEAMQAKGLKAADLCRLLGLGSEQVSRIFSGKRRLQLHEFNQIQDWLGAGTPLQRSPQAPGSTVIPMPGMVPLYGWVGAASDGNLIIAEQNLRGYVPMHPNQLHVREAFALEVADISMSPRYEPGEIIYVAPNRWPSRSQDCVLVTAEHHGYLKRFVRREEGQVVLFQLNPERELIFENENISAVHAVVGRG